MPGQLAIIQGHPDPAGNRFCMHWPMRTQTER